MFGLPRDLNPLASALLDASHDLGSGLRALAEALRTDVAVRARRDEAIQASVDRLALLVERALQREPYPPVDP